MKRFNFVAFFLLLTVSNLMAQEDLLSELEESLPEEQIYALGTFKGTRLINGHTVQIRDKGALDFLISHRFGTINSGFYELFGLDNAFIRLGLDYSLTDRFVIGVGRSSIDKSYDAYAKYQILKQQTGLKTIPVSVTALVTSAYKSSPRRSDNPDLTFSNRLSYASQLLIARKFSSKFSLQLSPIWVHRNRVQAPEINDTYGLGLGFRLLVTPSVSINTEYYYRLNPQVGSEIVNPLSFGVDIETGGHVFQLHITNSRGMIERAYLTETTGRWAEGDIYFGFNISRTFQLVEN